MSRRHCQRGFHILELLLVLAITALIAQLSYPRVRELREHVLLRSEAERMSSLLQSLATAALSGESEITVEAAGSAIHVTQGITTKSYALKPPVQIGAPVSISFHPSGAATPRTLTLLQVAARCEIIIALRGRVRVSCS